MDARRARFPEAGIIADQDSLVDILGRIHDVIEQPQSDPGIPLDLRGRPYEVRVWSMLRDIPAGSTTSYGALAAQLGMRDAREVTEAITRAVMTWRRHAPKRQCATIRRFYRAFSSRCYPTSSLGRRPLGFGSTPSWRVSALSGLI
jgi:hypothetical protein